MGPRTERRHQQGEESRQRILDATIQIAAERGYEGTSISLVSKLSGLPASSIYWHFASKDLLLAAVIERSFNRWLGSIPGWEPPSAGVALRQHIRTVWARGAVALHDNADFLRLGLMLSLERRPDEPQARTRFLESRRIAFEGQKAWFAGCMRWAGIEPVEAVCHNLATLQLAASDGLFIEAQITEDPDRTREMIDLIAEMLSSFIEREVASRSPAAVNPGAGRGSRRGAGAAKSARSR